MQIARAETASSAAAALHLQGRFAPSAWISEEEFAALRTRPELADAVAAFIASLVENYSGDAMLNKLVCDRGRKLITLFVLYLEVLPLPGTNTTGATLSAVQALCRQTSICSPGRAAAILAAMRFGGYIAPRVDPEDHRRRILVPTPKLLALHQQQWVIQFEAMAHLFPESALAPALLQTQAYRTAFLHELGTFFLAGFRVLDHAPALIELAESNAGLLLMSSLALRQLTGEGRPGETLPISISALARRFFVSRAHVRNMLLICERAGLLRRAQRSEDVVILPALTEALIQCYGAMFILFDRCAAGAARACQ